MYKKRHETSSPSGVLPLSAFALQRPPAPDQGLTIAGMVGRPVLFRNGPLQPLDGPRSLERVFLAVEAMHLDAAVVWHHFLETQMGERSEMQQFADRQLDADFVFSGCHLQLAGVVSPPPAGGADGPAEHPHPGLVSMNALFVGRPARERPYRFDGLRNVVRGSLARRLIV